MKLIECVPNFSEGLNNEVISSIARSIEDVEGISLLDVDPGRDTNRTVVTFVGPPDAVKEAAFQSIKIASELIDMSKHKGAHPRMGATDVFPLIPISGVSIEECIDLSHEIGQRVANELNISVYLYEKSATNSKRSNLADIRAGEYEGLSKKLKDPKWKPDYGPSELNHKAGATAIGVRNFLVAYNINLNTKDQRLATDIAFELREKGRSKRKPNPASPNLLDGEIVRNDDGSPVKIKGMFKDVKAVGWYIEDYNRAQISINFNNYKESSIHDVFDAACELATKRGVRVTGSELVGLIPLDALTMAGRFYLKKQNSSLGVSEKEIIEVAVQSLGLNDLEKFNPTKKIFEYAIRSEGDKLVNLSTSELIDEVSTNSPAPGGGSVSALLGSLGASLCSMVASLTFQKKDYIHLREEMSELGVEAQSLKERLTCLIDEDTNAFNSIMLSNKLPSATNEEKKIKNVSIKNAYQLAIDIPYEVASLCLKVLQLCAPLTKKGNPNSISDVGVACESALAGFRGASMNVMINLSGLSDKNYQTKMKQKLDKMNKEVEKSYESAKSEIDKIINS